MLPYADSHIEYRPHVTVAYLAKDAKDPYSFRSLYDDSLEGERFSVDQVSFTTPGGNEYVMPLLGGKAAVARRMASAEVVAKGMGSESRRRRT